MSSPRITSDSVSLVMTTGRALPAGSFLFKYRIHKEKEEKNKENPQLPQKKYEGDLVGKGKQAFVCGFIAPKKSFKTAVLRNKARRRGRSALQAVLKTQPQFVDSIQALFLLNPKALTTPFQSFVEEIQHVFKKSGILVKL